MPSSFPPYPLNAYVHLACPPGRYGENCEHHCWCYGHSECNQTTGKCVCKPGYKGFGCFESEFTSEGNAQQLELVLHYAANSLEETQSCTLSNSCSSLSYTECSDGFYGLGCAERYEVHVHLAVDLVFDLPLHLALF